MSASNFIQKVDRDSIIRKLLFYGVAGDLTDTGMQFRLEPNDLDHTWLWNALHYNNYSRANPTEMSGRIKTSTGFINFSSSAAFESLRSVLQYNNYTQFKKIVREGLVSGTSGIYDSLHDNDLRQSIESIELNITADLNLDDYLQLLEDSYWDHENEIDRAAHDRQIWIDMEKEIADQEQYEQEEEDERMYEYSKRQKREGEGIKILDNLKKIPHIHNYKNGNNS